MTDFERIDTSRQYVAISRELKMRSHPARSGPEPRCDGLTVGIVELTRDPPHGGEMHPDGDELVCVLSGSVRVTVDSTPEPITLAPGEACLIPQGEWHRIHLLEPTRLLHITPGPRGAHRPIRA
ncbi:MAG: cupin domain-containing protein [Steroidobacteraceae bacterium]